MSSFDKDKIDAVIAEKRKHTADAPINISPIEEDKTKTSVKSAADLVEELVKEQVQGEEKTLAQDAAALPKEIEVVNGM